MQTVPETVVVAGITAAATVLVAVIGLFTAVIPKLIESKVSALREEIQKLRERLDRAEAEIETEKRVKHRLLGIVRQLLTALYRYEPDTVERLRQDNGDLNL